MMRYLSKITLIGLAFVLTSCITNDFTKHRVAEIKARDQGFTLKLVKGDKFWFTSYQKITSPTAPYIFYIEGDGEAFKKRYIISDDPTPRNVMLLDLAALDTRPNIVYLARPCQYTPMEMNPSCNPSYWTDKRMSEDSVYAINEAIKNIAGLHPVDLIGFSGGGGIAVLVAARNNQVKSVTTLAGNLDHEAFNKFHHVRPMIGSLNPIDYATKINRVAQLHISGGMDKIVPAFIADDFIKASGNTSCIQREIIADATHLKNWNKSWPYILNIPLKCR